MINIFIFIFFILCNYNKCNKNFKDSINYHCINHNRTNIVNSTNMPLKSSKNINNKKNVILSVIQRYSLIVVLPFFKSLAYAKVYNTDIVIFVRNISEILINYLKSIGVFVYEIPSKYKNIPIINLRWKIYIDFLALNRNKYNLVFMADVRDTFFQKDMFKYYENKKSFLGIALEDDNLNEKINKKWVINIIGEEKHKIIKKERIICLGSLWGTFDKFFEFSNIIWNKLNIIKNSSDQGIANYLIYHEKIFKDCLVKSDNFGPIMTIGITKRNKIILDKQNNILNFKGEIASVIHQYDRKRDIALKIIHKFCPEIIYLSQQIIIDKKNQIRMVYKKCNETIYSNNIIYKDLIRKNKEHFKNIISFIIFFQIFSMIFYLKRKI